MSSRRGVSLVLRRELREGLRRRSYRVSVAIQVLVVVGIVAISSLTSGGAEEFDVGVVGPEARAVAQQARESEDAFGVKINLTEADAEAEARSQVADDELDAAITAESLLTTAGTSEQLSGLLQEASRTVRGEEELGRSDLSEQEVRAALDPPPLKTVSVGGDTGDDQAIAFIGNLLLYLVILFSGYAVAAALIEEKASRVIELVLPALRPGQIMNGKLIGMGLLGVIQVAAVAIAGVGAALALGEVNLPSSTGETVALLLVYFVAGYALYATIFGIGAALVSSPDDLQSVTSPGLIIAVASYITSLQAVDDPNGTLAQVLTFVPPAAPMIAPARAAQDALPLWQLLVSLILLAVTTMALLALARTVYQRAILRTGKPVRLGEALRSGR